jgi:hypothetical protein
VFAASVKLRRVGPSGTASVAHCVVRSSGYHFATRARCGSRGYIRNGIRGNRVGVAPAPSDAAAGPPRESSMLKCFAIHAPPFRGRGRQGAPCRRCRSWLWLCLLLHVRVRVRVAPLCCDPRIAGGYRANREKALPSTEGDAMPSSSSGLSCPDVQPGRRPAGVEALGPGAP